MVIKESDRLADVLARDDRVLETILAAAPDLRGLRNPLTRRVMGKLATVAQVARMAGMEPDILLRRINTAIAAAEQPGSELAAQEPADTTGAPLANQPDLENEVSEIVSTVPAFLAGLAPDRTSDLDVREDLRNGREPFSRIMAAKAALPPGGVLRLRATFEPAPLYAVMGKQGFDHWTEQLADDDWQVWFYPKDLADAGGPDEAAAAGGGEAVSAPVEGQIAGQEPDESDLIILDVRGLDPPEPMVRTLAALETLLPGKTLLQINERVPQFLLPRLEELGFPYEIREQAEGVVRVFIRRP